MGLTAPLLEHQQHTVGDINMGGWIREEVKVGEDAWGEVYG